MEHREQKSESPTLLSKGARDGSRGERKDRLYTQAVGEEDVSKREENIKHYSLGHNRYQAVMYPEPVHYRDSASGEWEEIDNTLEETVNAMGRPVLRNRANSLRVEFPRKMDSGNMVSIKNGERTFAWRFEREAASVEAKPRSGLQLKQARLVEAAKKLPRYVGRTTESLAAADLSMEIETAQERRADIATLKAENTYADILPGVTVRYTLSGDHLKEDIILASADALDSIAIRLPGDYRYEVTEQNALLVMDEGSGKVLFTMNTPVVYDAKGKETAAGIILTDCSGYVRMEYLVEKEYLREAVFPITIDPVIYSSNAINNIQDTTIGRNSSNHFPNEPFMMVGKYNSTLDTVAMLKFVQLARLTARDTVISAILRMKVKSSASDKYVAAYEILKPWNVATVNWLNFNPDNAANISTEAVDCVPGAASGWLDFDLTNLYRKWCTKTNGVSNNNGIAFRTPANISGANYSELYSANASALADRPVMYVNYVSHAGIEDWWEYEDMSAGRAGTVYADLFNGNMVLEHSDTAMTGNRNPVSVNHYYNSCLSNINSYGCGFGWKTDAHQKITQKTNNDKYYFVWEDGDGTEHYFERTGAQPYKDAEGMDLELTYHQVDDITQCYVTITDKEHNVMHFNVVQLHLAWLAWTQDACGNRTTYSYVSGHTLDGRLDKITDPVGRVTQFSYTAAGLISSIAIPAAEEGEQRYVYYTYDSANRLTGIRYSELGGTVPHTAYGYDGSTNMLVSARNYDGVQVNVGYEASSIFDGTTVGGVTDQMRRVLSLETVAVGDNNAVTTHGAKQLFAYKTMCTEVTAVEGENSDEGKKLYYQFNDSGNVICVRDDLGFAVFRKFETNIENKPSKESRLRKVVVNLLRRADFASNWTAGGTAAVDTTERCMNAPSVRLTGGSGEARYRQEVALEAGKEYTFSAYLKCTNVTGETGAYLRLRKADGTEEALSDGVTGSTEAASNNGLPTDGWERIKVTFSPAASGSYYADLVLDAPSGTAWFACPQVETGPVPNSFNIVSNGDFRYTAVSGAQTLPADWSKAAYTLNTAATGVKPGTEANGFPCALSGNILAVEGVPSKDYVGFVQTYNLSGATGDIFTLGGWANSKSVANGGKVYRFSLLLRMKKADGTWSAYTDCKLNPEWCGWQFASFAAVAPCDYVQVELTISYLWNCNIAQFSNIFLHREAFGVSYAYDDDKNLIAVTNLVNQKSKAEYDSAKNVRRYTQPGLDSTVADNQHWGYYGSNEAEQKKHLPWRTRTPMHMLDYFYYDSYGNTTASSRVDYAAYTSNEPMTVNVGEANYPHIRTETAYTANGNYTASTKDARGNTVTQSVNQRDGSLTSVTDPAGQTVAYTYDASKRVTKVQAVADGKTYENNYTYENDRIKTVRHNNNGNPADDVTYTFGFDELGRKTTVHVGEQLLSENTYANDRGGLLEQVDYGNGGKVRYSYDEFDRMTGVRCDEETEDRYTYVYGANGEAAEMTDKVLGEITRTEYDLADRPCQSEIRDAATGKMKYRTKLAYDKLNNLKHFAENVEGRQHKSVYTYDRDNRITQIAYDGSAGNVAYTYDALGRIATRTVTNGSNTLTTTYTYVAGGYGANSTTPLVAKIEQNGEAIEYAYDSRGNIISEKRGTLTTTYAYDGMGQLIRVNDPHEDATWVYSYDCGGNILSKARYAYTTGEVGAALETIPYAYGDSNWKDKLTAYNGQTIAYDAIGNMLNDGTRRYTWAVGRQLQRIEMPMTEEECAACAEGVSGEIRLAIDFSGSNVLEATGASVVATARVMNSSVDMTNDIPATMFAWTRDSGDAAADAAWNALHAGMKQITVTRAELSGSVKYFCTLQPFEDYGTMEVDSTFMASHTPGEADADDVFSIENGDLMVDTEKEEGAYSLAGQRVMAATLLGSAVTASMRVYTAWPDKSVDFKYNADGLRVQKKVTAGDAVTVTDYVLHGELVVETTVTRSVNGMAVDVQRMHFFYDAQSRPAMLEWNGERYTYVHNLQGDVIAILDSNGVKVVEYSYDAWGRCLSTTSTLIIADLNPFRYRGYVFDAELGLHYLESRYYNSDIGRFVSEDRLVGRYNDLLSQNVYSYCENQPIMMSDHTGHSAGLDPFNMPRVYDEPKDPVKAFQATSRYAVQQLIENAKIARKKVSKVNKKASSAGKAIICTLLWFKGQVDHDAPWDYKTSKNWPKWEFKGYSRQRLRNKKVMSINGIAMGMEEYGNYHYGFVGGAMGLSRDILHLGSYYAHYKKYGNLNEDEHDLEMIDAGYTFAMECIEKGVF